MDERPQRPVRRPAPTAPSMIGASAHSSRLDPVQAATAPIAAPAAAPISIAGSEWLPAHGDPVRTDAGVNAGSPAGCGS